MFDRLTTNELRVVKRFDNYFLQVHVAHSSEKWNTYRNNAQFISARTIGELLFKIQRYINGGIEQIHSEYDDKINIQIDKIIELKELKEEFPEYFI